MIALRSIAWAIAWRTLRLSKGGFLLLVARIVSPSVGADHHLEARVGLDLRQRVAELHVGEGLHVARKQRGDRSGCVRHDAELGLVERRRLSQ